MIKTFVIGIIVLRMTIPIPYVGAVPVTEASILSNVTSFFIGSHASADVSDSEDGSDLNSQKMPLLEAPANPLVAGTTSIAINSALLAIPSSLVATVDVTSDATTSKVASSASTNDEITNYTVKSGDTVTGIAKKFGISVNTVLWANNLRIDSTLKVGKSLTILPISGITYTVQKGDTLQGIANKYKGNVQEIMAYNNMSDDTLVSGQSIVIPNGEISSSQSTSDSTSSKPKTSVISNVSKVASAALGIKIASADMSQTTYKGYYMRPITGGTRTQGVHGHNAVDLADACGTPVYASAAGTVTIAKDDGAWNGGYGNYVVISHDNGSQTLYAHFSKVLVSEGMQVSQAQELGTMGETGEATGCHVHFEIRNGGIANPF